MGIKRNSHEESSRKSKSNGKTSKTITSQSIENSKADIAACAKDKENDEDIEKKQSDAIKILKNSTECLSQSAHSLALVCNYGSNSS